MLYLYVEPFSQSRQDPLLWNLRQGVVGWKRNGGDGGNKFLDEGMAEIFVSTDALPEWQFQVSNNKMAKQAVGLDWEWKGFLLFCKAFAPM
jgi:hypothetical protein